MGLDVGVYNIDELYKALKGEAFKQGKVPTKVSVTRGGKTYTTIMYKKPPGKKTGWSGETRRVITEQAEHPLVQFDAVNNHFFRVTKPVKANIFTGSRPSNYYYGATQILTPTYRETILKPGTEVHSLVGGLFAIIDGEPTQIRFEPPSEKSPFEKEYGYDASKRLLPISALTEIDRRYAKQIPHYGEPKERANARIERLIPSEDRNTSRLDAEKHQIGGIDVYTWKTVGFTGMPGFGKTTPFTHWHFVADDGEIVNELQNFKSKEEALKAAQDYLMVKSVDLNYVILKAKPYTRTRKGKLEHVKGYPGKPGAHPDAHLTHEQIAEKYGLSKDDWAIEDIKRFGKKAVDEQSKIAEQVAREEKRDTDPNEMFNYVTWLRKEHGIEYDKLYGEQDERWYEKWLKYKKAKESGVIPDIDKMSNDELRRFISTHHRTRTPGLANLVLRAREKLKGHDLAMPTKFIPEGLSKPGVDYQKQWGLLKQILKDKVASGELKNDPQAIREMRQKLQKLSAEELEKVGKGEKAIEMPKSEKKEKKEQQVGPYLKQMFGDHLINELKSLELSDKDIAEVDKLQQDWDEVINSSSNKELNDAIENTAYVHMKDIKPDDITGMMNEALSKISKDNPHRKKLEGIYDKMIGFIGEAF